MVSRRVKATFTETFVKQTANDASKIVANHKIQELKKPQSATSRGIHVMLTSNGSPYMNWQTRIMYYSYLQIANKPGGDFKHFTRVLHRSTDDALMDDIPTYRVKPLDPTCDSWCEYPVASRPWAIQQWLESGDVKGDWIFMIETDYVFVKPLSIPASGRAIGFPFGYITPQHPPLEIHIRKFYPVGDIKDIPATGNAPVLAPTEALRKVVPIWVNITAGIEADKQAKEVFGWVREMYAFSFSVAIAKMKIDLPPMPNAIMTQPPADDVLGTASVVHYTWGSRFKDDQGKVIWEFEKRSYIDRGLPKLIPEIPPGRKLTEAQTFLISKINEAISRLPKYTRRELVEMGKSDEQITATMNAERDRIARETAAVNGSTKRGEIHVMVTSDGSFYMNWQTKIMYKSWKRVAALPEGRDMKYFTRVLHRQSEDSLMKLIPTVRVEPLNPKCDVWCDYPVANRPWAIQQWLESGDVKGDWIFMIETDYIFVKPVQVPASGKALGFPFGYIIPTWPTIVHIMKRYWDGDLKEIPQTGNAPILARTVELRRVIPEWVNVTARIELDKEAKEKLGWVREMYAFSIACRRAEMFVDLPFVPEAIMVQPPADSTLGKAAIIHYTWGNQIKDANGSIIWEWDKRTWNYPPKLPGHIRDPPAGLATELQLLLVKGLNDGIDSELALA